MVSYRTDAQNITSNDRVNVGVVFYTHVLLESCALL